MTEDHHRGYVAAKTKHNRHVKTETIKRTKWNIDTRLEGLVGQDVRVEAKAFRPLDHHGRTLARWISVDSLVLPDGGDTGGGPVFFEGCLRAFERQVAVVFVTLDAWEDSRGTANGRVHYRGRAATILPGPALVELAYPFVVERIPAGETNYWQDLRLDRVQFDFPFQVDIGDQVQAPANSLPHRARETKSRRCRNRE